MDKIKEIISELPIKPLEKQIALMSIMIGANPTPFLVNALDRYETEKAEKDNPMPPSSIYADYDKTERLIAEMLLENTGASILDSGAIYGRHFEENRKNPDFKKRPKVKVTVWKDGEIDVTIDVFHFLTAFLERDKVAERLEDMLYNMADEPEYESYSWLAIMEEFMEFMGDLGWEAQGIANTYNWENLLSQVLQYGIIYNRETEEYYIILQIHNGCDVRGGYTKPRIFRLLDYDYFHMAMTDIYVSCRCTWGYSDDCGYHFYYHTDKGGDKEGFPDHWVIEPKKPNAENWEYQLRCKKCGELVEFSAHLDW